MSVQGVTGFASQELIERVVEMSSTDSNQANAKREIFDRAVVKVATDLTQEIIGEGKFNRSKSLINDKVLRTTARYIPFTKTGDLVPWENGYKMSVTVRVNVPELQKILRENGLFYETDSAPTVLPLIRVQDQIAEREFSWWSPESDRPEGLLLQRWSQLAENTLRSALLKNHFYSLRPRAQKLVMLLPENLRVENLKLGEWQNFAPQVNAQMIIDGSLQVSRAKVGAGIVLDLRLTAIQSVNGRPVGEVVRRFEAPGMQADSFSERKLREHLETSFTDLSAQILDAWQKGSIGASLYRLVLRGRPGLLLQEPFREAFQSRLRQVKSVKERLISSDEIVYEMDSAIGPKDILRELSQRSEQFEVKPGFMVVAESATDTELIFRIKKREIQ